MNGSTQVLPGILRLPVEVRLQIYSYLDFTQHYPIQSKPSTYWNEFYYDFVPCRAPDAEFPQLCSRPFFSTAHTELCHNLSPTVCPMALKHICRRIFQEVDTVYNSAEVSLTIVPDHKVRYPHKRAPYSDITRPVFGIELRNVVHIIYQGWAWHLGPWLHLRKYVANLPALRSIAVQIPPTKNGPGRDVSCYGSQDEKEEVMRCHMYGSFVECHVSDDVTIIFEAWVEPAAAEVGTKLRKLRVVVPGYKGRKKMREHAQHEGRREIVPGSRYEVMELDVVNGGLRQKP